MSKSKNSLLLAVILSVAFISAGCSSGTKGVAQPPKEVSSEATTPEQVKPITNVSYAGKDGQNALDLLKASHQVEAKTFKGIGEMVSGIDGTIADQSHFWAFYVNGKSSDVGASAYVSKNSDTLEWKLEEIKF